MKFKRSQANWLDGDNDSALFTRVAFNTNAWSYGDEDNKEPSKHHTPVVDLQLFDCSRRAQIHEFGTTREKQLEKLDLMINQMNELRESVVDAWDAYDDFWKNQNKVRYY